MAVLNVIAQAVAEGRARYEDNDSDFTVVIGLSSGKELHGLVRLAPDNSDETFNMFPVDPDGKQLRDMMFVRLSRVDYAYAKRR